MSVELKANVRQVLDRAWNEGIVDGLDELYAADFVRHSPPYTDVESLDAFKAYIEHVRMTYSDVNRTIEEVLIADDILVTRFTFRGRHTGRGIPVGIPPTGESVTVPGCTVSHMKDGKVIEEWVYADWLGLLQQLGEVPSPGTLTT